MHCPKCETDLIASEFYVLEYVDHNGFAVEGRCLNGHLVGALLSPDDIVLVEDSKEVA